jgi:hypothetical protein
MVVFLAVGFEEVLGVWKYKNAVACSSQLRGLTKTSPVMKMIPRHLLNLLESERGPFTGVFLLHSI